MFKFIQKQLKNKKGFTLVELVVVIAILGILAAIAVPKLGASRQTAAKTAHEANIRTLTSAATMFIADEGVPSGEDATWTSGKKTLWGDYLQEWPDVPTGIGLSGEYELTFEADGDVSITPLLQDEVEEEE